MIYIVKNFENFENTKQKEKTWGSSMNGLWNIILNQVVEIECGWKEKNSQEL